MLDGDGRRNARLSGFWCAEVRATQFGAVFSQWPRGGDALAAGQRRAFVDAGALDEGADACVVVGEDDGEHRYVEGC